VIYIAYWGWPNKYIQLLYIFVGSAPISNIYLTQQIYTTVVYICWVSPNKQYILVMALVNVSVWLFRALKSRNLTANTGAGRWVALTMLFLLFIGSTVSSRVSNPGTDYQSRDFGIGATGIPGSRPGSGLRNPCTTGLGRPQVQQIWPALQFGWVVFSAGNLYTAFLTLILFGFSDGAVCASVKSHVPAGRRVPPIKWKCRSVLSS